jgi:hypothetical protein
MHSVPSTRVLASIVGGLYLVACGRSSGEAALVEAASRGEASTPAASPPAVASPAAVSTLATAHAVPPEALPILANVGGKPQGGKPPLLPCPAHVPAALDPPETATLALALPADGVQVYACGSAKPGAAPAWSLEAPHALLGAGNDISGIHFAGPLWQGLDGSAVKGAKLAAADAPDAHAIPWLLLSGTPAAAGSFASLTFIQRLDTVGGKAPAAGCDAGHVGAKALVPYKAKYYFYRSANTGEPVQQCRSERAKSKLG